MASDIVSQRSMKSIGFVGLGTMGLPMAENLSRSPGALVKSFDRDPSPFEILAEHTNWGKSLFPAESLSDFSNCQVVITMLPDSNITNAVVLGTSEAPGLVTILAPGSIVLDMGSSNPVDTGRLAEKLATKGIRLIDAPVSGSVIKARSGELSIMVGARETETADIDDILRWMGTTIIHTGGVGSAHAMKTLNNYVFAAGLLAASEALLVARAMNLDEEKFTDVLNVSSGRNIATETKLRQSLLPRTYTGGFALRLMAKDLAVANQLLSLTSIDAPQLELCTALWRDAVAAMPVGADNTEIHRFLESRQGGGTDN